MGIFSKVQESKVSGGGVYFLPGVYRVEIENVKAIQSRRNNKDYFIIECRILESSNEDRPAGTSASQAIDITNVMGPVNIKAFIAAASGITPTADDVNEQLIAFWEEATDVELSIEEICELVCDEDENPLQGLEMDLECVLEKTRNTGSDFTKHYWTPREA